MSPTLVEIILLEIAVISQMQVMDADRVHNSVMKMMQIGVPVV